MYTTLPSAAGFDQNAGWSAGSRGYFSTDLYTIERHLIIKCLETLLYEKQQYLGMLNPYADEYFPSTEKRYKNDTNRDFPPEQKNHGNNGRIN